jgi:antitoxin (DNA-binding transcriptional repressor) of toxin-antitoxin stability system
LQLDARFDYDVSMVVSLKEAQEKLSELVIEANKGSEIFIRSADGLTVKLMPTASTLPSKRTLYGSMKGVFKMSDDFNAPLEEEEKAIYGDDA